MARTDPWSLNQEKLNLGSKLLLNAELIELYPETFDETTIDERTEVLAQHSSR